MKTPIIIVVFAAIVGIVAAAEEPAPPKLPENHHLKGQHRMIAAVGRHASKTHSKRHSHATMATEKVAVAAPPDGTDASCKFEVDGHSKLCLAPGPCFKKKLVCPKKCSKLPGEGEAAASARRLVKNHLPGQYCFFNCKECIAHC